ETGDEITYPDRRLCSILRAIPILNFFPVPGHGTLFGRSHCRRAPVFRAGDYPTVAIPTQRNSSTAAGGRRAYELDACPWRELIWMARSSLCGESGLHRLVFWECCFGVERPCAPPRHLCPPSIAMFFPSFSSTASNAIARARLHPTRS